MVIIFAIVAVGLLGYLWFYPQNFIYRLVGPAGLYQRMVEARDYGIQKAKERGEYRCCIEPPCTMCYSEGNKWNYGQAGTCACDDFIARGEEPCPQCAKALNCESSPTGDHPETCIIPSE